MANSEFEELDKAVASVLGTTPAAISSSKPTEDEPATVELTTSTEPFVKPAERTFATPGAPASAPRPRSPGRFMDVVHPSSAMRPAQTATPAAQTVEPAPTKPVEAPTESADEPFTQPDPLDFHGFTMDETPKQAEPGVEESVPADDISPEPATEDKPAEPLTTPFLSDTKVEKRPLGAFSDTVKPAESPAESNGAQAQTDAEKEAALPAELHTELLSIEASEQTSPMSPDEMPPVPSIVQQYQEKPNSDTHPSAAIYDTESYQTPLSHTVKKKRDWLIIVWVLGLVVVGAGIGALLYFFVLPKLG